MSSAAPIPLPRAWSRAARSSILHTISLASASVRTAWATAGDRRSALTKARSEADWLRTEVRLLREELEIKNERWRRAPARRRPHYGPVARMRILELRAARGWSAEEVARRFLVTDETIAHWMRRLDRDGEAGLVQTSEPVNKYPAFVGYMVRRLKTLYPALGKQKIAQILARAGLHLGVSTVGRMLKRDISKDDPIGEEPVPVARRIRAKAPNNIWHVDLTTVPTAVGFWVPWMPFAKHQRWPFSWWVAVAVDHASRLVVGFAVFKQRPTLFQVCSFLGKAMKRAGSKPKVIITDRGVEFREQFRAWCRPHHIRPRYGAVGQHGSIAIVERFIRSMKSECTRRITVPFRLASMRRDLDCYARWFNEHRPHSGIDGRTPMEVYRGLLPANKKPRCEPRKRWPKKARCAAPNVPVDEETSKRPRLVVSRFEGRAHLPVAELRRAS